MPLRTLMIGVATQNPEVDNEESALEAPSLFDYDIVIADVDSVLSLGWKVNIPPNEYINVDEKAGRSFRKALRKLSSDAVALLEKGGMLVCLLKPKRGISWQWWSNSRVGYEREFNNNYDWIPIEGLDRVVDYGSGQMKKLCDEPGPFGRYIKMVETYWIAYFNNIDRLDIESQNLALNEASKPIAVEVSMGNGLIVFLPPSKHPHIGDILLECATRSLRKKKERSPPSWMEKITVPGENADRKSLDALAEKISKLEAEYDVELTKFEENTLIKKLFYEKNEPLEEAVRRAFEELGFTLTKEDDKDWIASSNTGEAILEVTGSDASVDIDKLRQLLNYLIDDYKESGVEKKAILVGNHFANDPPETRGKPFTEKVVGESGVHSICLLTTLNLFKIVCDIREGKAKPEGIRRRIFETVGIFKLN